MRDDSREPSRPSTADLREQTAALLLGLSTTKGVIALAADLLADGHDSPSLIALASLYASATSPEIFDLSSSALAEAGDPPLDRDSEEIPLLALRVACRRFLDGDLDLRAFSSWAHDLIGHDEPEAAQPFVEMDDVLDLYTVSRRSRKVARRYSEEVVQLATTYLASTAPRPMGHG
ncbi:hypothetical protein [Rathayibacter sp. VKM Ac-2805]|uniref:hypothetical protein n=1 Tax=Rathayibacter sp. VKM Ac-2805 TaxID=2609258 RepID=UPI00131FD004|nr:hypothetical protein [Rathayibacter sp. VKM Ac-2805]QHC72686.1 hypothetical protein GSU40_02540 [Rathayibacter sp. VKM Ac-2805]